MARLGANGFFTLGLNLLRYSGGVLGLLLKHFGGRIPIERGIIFAIGRADRLDDRALFRCHRPQPRARRGNQRALDDRRAAIYLKRRDQRLTHPKFGDRGFDIEIGVDPESLCRRLDRSLIARSEGAQCVLDPVAELACDLFRDVDRVLGDEIDAHALGADQPDNLLHLVEQRLRRVLEQQMRFVEKEHQLGLVRIAHFGQRFEQFRQQPQQEGGV